MYGNRLNICFNIQMIKLSVVELITMYRYFEKIGIFPVHSVKKFRMEMTQK